MTKNTMEYGVRRKPKPKEPNLGTLFIKAIAITVPVVLVYSYGTLWLLGNLGLN